MPGQPISSFPAGPDVDAIGQLRFARAMDAKLAQKRTEGRGGWHKPGECTVDDLREELMRHAEAGRWVNVANYAMMLWNREHPEGV
jgi:hypothetical protein